MRKLVFRDDQISSKFDTHYLTWDHFPFLTTLVSNVALVLKGSKVMNCKRSCEGGHINESFSK